MASCLVRFGRFAFFVLLGLQAYSLASYPAKYKENDGYYGLTALFLPAFALRFYIMITNKHLQWLFVVWLLYVIGLVIFIGFIFGGAAPVEDRFKETTKSSGDVNNLTNCNESTNVTNATNSTTSLSHSTNLTFSTEQKQIEFFGPNVLKMTLCLTPRSFATSSKHGGGLNSLQRTDVDVVSTHCTRPVRWRRNAGGYSGRK